MRGEESSESDNERTSCEGTAAKSEAAHDKNGAT